MIAEAWPKLLAAEHSRISIAARMPHGKTRSFIYTLLDGEEGEWINTFF
jgi:hypothetical protein